MLANFKPVPFAEYVLLLSAVLCSCTSTHLQQSEQRKQAEWAAQQAEWAARDTRWTKEREQRERDWAAQNEQPTAAELAAADCGPPPPAGWRALLEPSLRAALRDPDSGVFRFFEPEKAGTKAGDGAPFEFVWKVYYEVNARNGFGGYAGFQSSAVYFKNGEWLSIDEHTTRQREWRARRDAP
jgi:hypothetical protein